MALKHDRPGEELTVIQRWRGGLTWIAHPDTQMQRASHALVVTDNGEGRSARGTQSDDSVWLVDPMDADGLDEELDALGTVAGVVVLTNSHGRHADRLANRHDVAIHVPACFEESETDFDAPVELFDDELADTGFELVWEKDGSGWKEGTLYHPERGTLVGHGEPVFENAQAALEEALARSHGGTPRAVVQSLPTFARHMYSEIRS